MKKLTAILFAVLYLATSSGATVELHYCMGKFASWKIGVDQAENCPSCGMPKTAGEKDGCCHNESKLVKSNTDQKVASFMELSLQPLDLPASPFANPRSDNLPLSSQFTLPYSHGPPERLPRTRNILFCTWLI